jgi:hypothetical protein
MTPDEARTNRPHAVRASPISETRAVCERGSTLDPRAPLSRGGLGTCTKAPVPEAFPSIRSIAR